MEKLKEERIINTQIGKEALILRWFVKRHIIWDNFFSII